MGKINPGRFDGSTINIDLTSSGGSPVIDQKSVVNLAAAGTDNHDYTAVGTVFRASQFTASASGMIKVDVFKNGSLIATYFNSTNAPIVDIRFEEDVNLSVGQVFRLTITNREVAAQNVYSTIIGEQIAP